MTQGEVTTTTGCGACFYWRLNGKRVPDPRAQEMGECLRFPPSDVVVRPHIDDPGEDRFYLWPQTRRDDYCGEFQP